MASNMKTARFLSGILSVFLCAASVMTAHAEDFSSAEEKAAQAHELAMTDVVYAQEDFKALYYQNIEIISVLKEIRDEIHAVNMREAKDTGKA